MSDYPESWVSCEIGEIAKVVGGATPPSKDPSNFQESGGIPWITPADLSGYRKKFIDRGARNLSERGFVASSTSMLPAGGVLFSSRAPVGYVAIAANPVCTNQGFKSFVLPTGVNSSYVYYYLRSIKQIAEERATGTTFKELSGAATSKLPFLLAPTEEQKRVADKLDVVLARVDACREHLDCVPGILKRFRQVVLDRAMSGGLTEEWRDSNPDVVMASTLLQLIAEERVEKSLPSSRRELKDEGIDFPETELPKTWAWCRVGQIADVRLGGTPTRNEDTYWKGDIPWVSSGEVSNCRIADTAEKITEKGMSNSNAKLYPKGSVLIAMIGEGKTRGQSAILDIEATTNQNVAGLVFDVPLINPEFVWYWALGEYERTRSVGRGGNQPALNGAKIRALPIPLPPSEEQREIVTRVESLFAYANHLEARYTAAHTLVDRLTPTILAKAFRGELVPQDSNEESAETLLAQIRTTRLDSVAAPKRPRGRPRIDQPRAPKEKFKMTKSRNDQDVRNKGYLAAFLRKSGGPMPVEDLFRLSELPLTDFYKQLAWEIYNGHIKDDPKHLEAI